MSLHHLLQEQPHKLFFHYLGPSISATMVSSIYILVDTIMIGRGIGADGLAALNLLLPLVSVYIAVGMLFGVGGGVLMSVANGAGEHQKAQGWFSTALVGCVCSAILLDVGMYVFFEPMAWVLGASESTISMVRQYGHVLVLGSPCFVMSSFLQVFVRNDHAPRRAMAGVLIGAVLNIVLDYWFIFPLQMGMFGAAAATILANTVTACVIALHFFSVKNTMHFTWRAVHLSSFQRILACGFSSFMLEAANALLMLVFNLQLLRYMGETGVVVYGIISNCIIVALSLFNGVAQASQPLMAANFGAHQMQRVRCFFRYGIVSAAIIGVALCAIGQAFPQYLVQIFVAPTQELLQMGIPAIRSYFCALLLMGSNIFLTTYFQSIVQPNKAICLGLLRGVVFSLALLLVLPVWVGPSAIWWVVPLNECLSFGVAQLLLHKSVPQIRPN